MYGVLKIKCKKKTRICESLCVYLLLYMSQTSKTLGDIIGKSLLKYSVYKGNQPFPIKAVNIPLYGLIITE